MNFSERLKKYRNNLCLKKKELADKLDTSESYYNMIENGKRNPSKKFLVKLVSFSKQPEEYWLYGIEEKEYIEKRNVTKATKLAFENVIEMNLIKNFKTLFDKSSNENKIAEDLLIAAIKADLSYFFIDDHNENKPLDNITELPIRNNKSFKENNNEQILTSAAHAKTGDFSEEDYKHDMDLMNDDELWD